MKQNINRFNRAAKFIPFLVGTALDTYACPPDLISDWLQEPKHENLLIRVAVREAEAWVLADKRNFAKFLGIRPALIPNDPESLPDPKRTLVGLARKARSGYLRDELCPPEHSTRQVGPNYNPRLGTFVLQQWDPLTAQLHSASLARTINRLRSFALL